MLNSFYIILFIISTAALIIACIVFVHNDSEYYDDTGDSSCITKGELEGMREDCGCDAILCGDGPPCTGKPSDEHAACVCSPASGPASCSCTHMPSNCIQATTTGRNGQAQTGCELCDDNTCPTGGTTAGENVRGRDCPIVCGGTNPPICNQDRQQPRCEAGCGKNFPCPSDGPAARPACVCSKGECTCEAKPRYCEKVVSTGSGLAPQSGCKQCSSVACGWSGNAPASNLSCNPPCDDNAKLSKCEGSGRTAKCTQAQCSKYFCEKVPAKGGTCGASPSGAVAVAGPASHGCPRCLCSTNVEGSCCSSVGDRDVFCNPFNHPPIPADQGVCTYS